MSSTASAGAAGEPDDDTTSALTALMPEAMRDTRGGLALRRASAMASSMLAGICSWNADPPTVFGADCSRKSQSTVGGFSSKYFYKRGERETEREKEKEA